MKLLELQVEGYRSLKNVTWKPTDLNVLIGPNGSGKTNLVSMLKLLAVVARGGLKKYIAEQGGLQSMCWDRKSDPIQLGVKTLETMEPGEEDSQETFSYKLRFSMEARGFDYSLMEHLSRVIRSHGQPDEEYELVNRPALPSITGLAMRLGALPNEEEYDLNESVLTVYRASIGHYITVGAFARFLKGWTIYHELDTNQDAPIRRAVPAQWEKALAEDTSNVVAYLHTFCSEDRDFKRDLELAMKAAFGDDFEELVFAPASDQRIQMRIRWRSLKNPISAPDLSDGTLRFLFLVGALLNPQPPPMIVLEEPEIGLHPRMMSIIAEYAVDAAERTQVIFTTHSPDFLSAFRDTIPTTTVCNWENGETVLRVLEDKDMKYWLQEYTLGQFAFSGAAEAVE